MSASLTCLLCTLEHCSFCWGLHIPTAAWTIFCTPKVCKQVRVAGRHQRELAALRGELAKAVKGQPSSTEDAPSRAATEGDNNAAGDTSTVDEMVGGPSHMLLIALLLPHM